MVTFICFPPQGTQNLLSPREDTSRTGEAKLNLVRLRTFRLREIVFELIAKSYNFERGFFFFQSTPLLTSPSERNYVLYINKHVILSEAKYLKLNKYALLKQVQNTARFSPSIGEELRERG